MRAVYRSLRPLVLWRVHPRPINWEHLFGNNAPVTMEIGIGNGDYLVAQALQHPERNFVGVEMEWEGVQRALRRCAAANVPNVRLMFGDVRPILKRAVAPRSLQRVYTLFPCPWPKERHQKHRLFSQPFLQLVNSRLVDGGEAYLLTDHEEYFGWVLSQLTDTGFEAYARTVPPGVNTKYERKWLSAGQTRFYELHLRKKEHCPIPLLEDVPMETYRVARFDPEHFHPEDAHDEPYVFFKEVRYDPERAIGMVRVVVVEDDLTQHFWIEIVSTPQGWHIRPMVGCGIVPTVGVQRALDRVRMACESLP